MLSAPSAFLKEGLADAPSRRSSERGGLGEEKPVLGLLAGLSELPLGENDLESGERFLPGDGADESFKELKFGRQR